MDDLISRQAAIDRINKQREHLQPDIYPQDQIGDAAYRICAEFIGRLPSAQPEPIRCKDCKHRPIATRADEGVLWGFSVEFPDERCPLQCEDGWYNYYPEDDFYCANAERKVDE